MEELEYWTIDESSLNPHSSKWPFVSIWGVETARKFLIQQMFAVPQVGIRLYVKLKQADVIWCRRKKN